jgi:DNA polymerase Ligase (LigD)
MQEKRYVIQQHTTTDGPHWDLMLEQGSVLTTFRLEEMPSEIRDRKIQAERIFDHPLRFLTYEGPVQQGTGRVRIVDRGTCHITECDEEAIALSLAGDTLGGDFTLTRTHEAFWDFAHTNRSTQE